MGGETDLMRQDFGSVARRSTFSTLFRIRHPMLFTGSRYYTKKAEGRVSYQAFGGFEDVGLKRCRPCPGPFPRRSPISGKSQKACKLLVRERLDNTYLRS